MLCKRLGFYPIILVLLPNVSYGADLSEQILQNQKQQVQELERKNLIEKTIQENKNLQKKEESSEDIKKSDICFDINKIIVEGNSIINAEKIQQITGKYEGKCLGIGEIKILINKLNDLYQNKGYTTTRVVLPKQNLKSGELKLQVIIGYIESINYEEQKKKYWFSKWFDRKNNAQGRKQNVGSSKDTKSRQQVESANQNHKKLITSFGKLSGKVLNLRDLEQGIDVINRLKSNEAKLKINPGSEVRKSKVLIANDRSFPIRFNVAYNNLGTKSTGRYNTNLILSYDDMIGINDHLYLSYNSSDFKRTTDDNYADSYYLKYEIPYQYWLFNYSLSYSDFAVFTTTNSGEIVASLGTISSHNITATKVVLRNNKYKLSLNLGLGYGKIENYTKIRDIKTHNQTASYNLGSGDIGFTLIRYGKKSNLIVSGGINQGIDFFDNAGSVISTGQKANFTSYSLNTDYLTYFILPKIKQKLDYHLTLSGQYSNDSLYSAKRMSLGGVNSIIGFHDSSFIGDSRVRMRNKISFDLKQIKSISQKLPNHAKVKLDFLHDIGYGKLNSDIANNDGILSGVGVGLSFETKNFIASITYGKALKVPGFIKTEHQNLDGSEKLYFKLSTRF